MSDMTLLHEEKTSRAWKGNDTSTFSLQMMFATVIKHFIICQYSFYIAKKVLPDSFSSIVRVTCTFSFA